MLDKIREGSDFELVKSGVGKKSLAVVARLCLPPRGCFSTLGICKRLRIINMSVDTKAEKVGANDW